MKLIVLAPLVALALAGALLAACTDDAAEDALPVTPSDRTPAATPTATPTPAPTEPPGGAGGGGGDQPATVVPPPDKSTSPVPENWATFANQKIVPFTFRYPSDWHVGPGVATISSWDPATWDKPYYPPNGIMLQFDVIPLDQASARPPEATDITLGSLAGWEIVRTRDSDVAWTRSHVVTAELNGYRMQLVGAFAKKDADETTFLQIVNTFRFTD